MTEEHIDGIKTWLMAIVALLIMTLLVGIFSIYSGDANKLKGDLNNINDVSSRTYGMLSALYPLYNKSLEQLHRVKTIPVQDTKVKCDYIEGDVGLANKTLFFSNPYNMYGTSMERLMESLNITFVTVCSCNYEDKKCWDKCEERGFLINNSVSMMQKYNFTMTPTVVFANCGKMRVGSMAAYDEMWNEDYETRDLLNMFPPEVKTCSDTNTSTCSLTANGGGIKTEVVK